MGPIERREAVAMSVEAPELAPRRVPSQARARATVEHLLDVAAGLLEEVGVDDFNTNLLADRAEVRVRTVYRYFPNKLAIVVALAERYARVEAELVESVLRSELGARYWRSALDRATDRYVHTMMATPGFLAVRRATRAVPELRAVDDRASEQVAAGFAALLLAAGVQLPARRRIAIARTVIEAAVAVLDLAYAAPPQRRRALVAELKRLQTAYLATYIEPDLGGARDGDRS